MWLTLSTLAFAGNNTVLLSVEDVDQVPPIAGLGRCFRSSRVCLVEGGDPAQLARLPGVRRAERDAVMTLATGVAGDPTADCPEPYELDAIGVRAAWDQVCGVSAPVVAIEDSGFRATHHDLAGRVAGQHDYGNNDGLAEVSWFSAVPEHGTFIAGVVAAVDDDAGRTGIAPEGSLFLQKIADQSGALFFSYAIAAMDDLVAAHPEVGVLNYSIAATYAPQAFSDAVEALGAADIVMVAAAANCTSANCLDANNDQHPEFPASYPFDHVLAVASLREDGTLDPYSHYGRTTVDVAAPGAELCSLGVDNDDQVLVSSGTSFATPVVAGTVALLREAWPRLDAAEAVDVVVRACTPDAALSTKVRCGGALSAERALEVPVVSFSAPADLDVAPTAELALSGDSRAAGGQLFVVVTHPAQVEVDAVGSVTFCSGDPVPLPGGDELADDGGTWFVVDLPADGPVDLRFGLRAVGTGSGPATVRVVPYAGDLVGAWSSFDLTVSADVGAGTTATDPTGITTDPSGDGTAADDPRGCGCQPGAPGSGWLALALAALFTRGRAGGAPASRR